MSGSQSSRAITSGIWYTIGNFVTKAAGFITTPIFTRLLTKAEIGDYTNFVSWIELLTVICTFDLFSSVMLAKYDYKNELDNYISANLLAGTFITSIMFLISLIFRDHLLDILNFTNWQLNVAFIYMAVYPASQMFLVRSRIFYKYKSFVVYSFGSTIISTVISLILTISFADRLEGRIIGQYIPLIALNLIIYILSIRRCKGIIFRKEYVKYGMAISVPLIWHTLAGNVLSLSDRVMIREMCGSESTALYGIGYYCALIVSVLWSSMNNAWSPWAYDMMSSGNTKALKRASIPYILFFGIVVFFFLLIGPEILLLMGGSSYNTAVEVLPPIMVSVVFQFVYSLYVNIEFFNKKQIYIAIGTSIAALVNFGLNIIFIPAYGYIAAAYTTLAGYIVLFFVHFFFVKHLGKTNYYNTKFILSALGFFLVLSFVLKYIYMMNTVRYLLIFIVVFVFFVRVIRNRNQIMENLRKKSIVGVVNSLIGDYDKYIIH